jgi:hypothetical protein
MGTWLKAHKPLFKMNHLRFKMRVQNHLFVFVVLLFVLATICLSGCADMAYANPDAARSPLPTMMPGAHQDHSAAQATLAAGQAQAQNLAIQSTQVALNMTQAAATDTHFLRQTERAQQETATASQEAHLLGLTQTAAIEQTQAAQATNTAHAIHTATAWPQTATPLAATQQVIIAQAEAEQRRAYWEQILIPMKVIFLSLLGFVILVLLVLGGIRAYRRLLPALELRLGTIPRGPHDAPLLLLNNLIIDPDRNFGPALHLGKSGAETTGLAPTPQLQERLVARDQAVDLVRSQPSSRSRRQSDALEPFAEIVEPPPSSVEIEIVEPDQVQPWLDEVEHNLLPSGTAQKE